MNLALIYAGATVALLCAAILAHFALKSLATALQAVSEAIRHERETPKTARLRLDEQDERLGVVETALRQNVRAFQDLDESVETRFARFRARESLDKKKERSDLAREMMESAIPMDGGFQQEPPQLAPPSQRLRRR